jgi:hypothetical protein
MAKFATNRESANRRGSLFAKRDFYLKFFIVVAGRRDKFLKPDTKDRIESRSPARRNL